MKNFLAVGSLVVLLGGCGAIAALEQMDREADQRACDGFGFRQGTEDYSNCLISPLIKCRRPMGGAACSAV